MVFIIAIRVILLNNFTQLHHLSVIFVQINSVPFVMVRRATGTFPDCPSVLPDREQTFEFITVLLPVDLLLHAFYKKLKVCVSLKRLELP